MIHSPGTTRHTPPPIPEDVLALALLMELTFVWSGAKKHYWVAVRETPDMPEQLFSIDPYVAESEDQWLDTMKFIADHIRQIKTGELNISTLPPTGRKIFEDYIVNRVQQEADANAQTEEKTNDSSNQ